MARRDGHCRKCNYDLFGLDEIGQCPECGNQYNRRTGAGMVTGSQRQVSRDRWLRRIVTVVFGVFATTALFCTGFPLIVSGLSSEFAQKVVSWGGALTLLFTLIAASSYMGEKGDQEDENESI